MGSLGFFLITGVLFSIALYAAGYYMWSVPEQEASDRLGSRLRELRAHMRGRNQKAPELLRREHRGQFAFLGDLQYRAADVLGLSVALGVCCLLLTTLFGMMFFLRILFAAILGFVPVVYILQKRSRRMKKFEEQLPDAIDLFTRTMRAGHNIHSGLETIATETSDPVKMDFKKLIEELALGSQVEPARHELGKRVPLLDRKFFITSLILQRQTGANMVSVLENLSTLVRERLNMAAKMKAHTAQQRFSAGLLCCLPLVVGIGFWILKPDYVRLLWTDPVGTKFFIYAICSEIVGILVIRKLANVKV